MPAPSTATWGDIATWGTPPTWDGVSVGVIVVTADPGPGIRINDTTWRRP